jgi:hypothetical protein
VQLLVLELARSDRDPGSFFSAVAKMSGAGLVFSTSSLLVVAAIRSRASSRSM